MILYNRIVGNKTADSQGDIIPNLRKGFNDAICLDQTVIPYNQSGQVVAFEET